MKMHFRTALSTATAGIALFAAGAAYASPLILTLTAQDITSGAPALTTVFCDVASAACTAAGGIVSGSLNSIVGGNGIQADIQFTAQNSTAIIGTAPSFNNQITTSALTVLNTSTTNTYRLTASLVGYNFQGPDNVFSFTGNGQFIASENSQMVMKWYDDPSNSGIADASTLVGSFTSPVAGSNLLSFSTNLNSATLANPDTGLYSMTETWTYTLAPGGQLQNRGQTENKVYTPEPASLLLLGASTLGIGLIRRRRR